MDGFTGPLIVKGLNKSRPVETEHRSTPAAAFQLPQNRHTHTNTAGPRPDTGYNSAAWKNAVVTWLTPEDISIHLEGREQKERTRGWRDNIVPAFEMCGCLYIPRANP